MHAFEEMESLRIGGGGETPLIAGLKDTLEDRSLALVMFRRWKDEPGRTKGAREAQALRDVCALACLTGIEDILMAYNLAPKVLDGRTWMTGPLTSGRPLLALAMVAHVEARTARSGSSAPSASSARVTGGLRRELPGGFVGALQRVTEALDAWAPTQYRNRPLSVDKRCKRCGDGHLRNFSGCVDAAGPRMPRKCPRTNSIQRVNGRR